MHLADYLVEQSGVATPTPVEKKGEQSKPSWLSKVPGFPETEAAYWIAPEGSRNAGRIYGSVNRVALDAKTGRKRTFKTFPLAGGGLVSSLIGTAYLLEALASQPNLLSESDRRMNEEIAHGVYGVVLRHLSPVAPAAASRSTASTAAASPSVIAPVNSVLVERLGG